MDNKATEKKQPPNDQSLAQKRAFKIPAQPDTFDECSAERKKFFGDAKGKAAFHEFYWSFARDMTIMQNNADVQLEYMRAVMEGEDCLTRRVLLGEPNDATAEQKTAIYDELHKRSMQGEKEKAERGHGVDDNGKWWEKFDQPVGRYEEEAEEADKE